MFERKVIKNSLGTHSGTFHADEVTACSLLQIFNLVDEDKIIRSRDLKLLSSCEYMCDVGGIYDPKHKKFDHHQKSYDGLLSSAGMVLKYLLDFSYINYSLYSYLCKTLVNEVDDIDNGRFPKNSETTSFSSIVAHLNPVRHDSSEDEFTRSFHVAVKLCKLLLKNFIEKHSYSIECAKKIESVMKQKVPVLIFDESIPWLDSFFQLRGDTHPALFIIMPSGEYWKSRGLPPTLEQRMRVRCPLPKSWAGLMGDELKAKSEIPGAIFCHKGRFISIWKTKEDAIRASKKAMG